MAAAAPGPIRPLQFGKLGTLVSQTKKAAVSTMAAAAPGPIRPLQFGKLGTLVSQTKKAAVSV